MDEFPLIFADGTEIFDKLKEKYKTHKNGYFILAPSGAGKTHFCKNQTESNWIDGDELWIKTGAHPDRAWWTESLEIINEVDQKSDVMTVQAKKQGLWLMGASNYWLKPDAIVLPDWDKHKEYIKHRQDNDYDGGATTDDLDNVQSHRVTIEKWHTDSGVPSFSSIEDAVNFLSKSN